MTIEAYNDALLKENRIPITEMFAGGDYKSETDAGFCYELEVLRAEPWTGLTGFFRMNQN